MILSYDKDQGFQVQMQEEVNGNSYLGTRGVYANEKFYVINGNAIEAYRVPSCKTSVSFVKRDKKKA